MTDLMSAIYGKASGSAFSTAIGGRLYREKVPQNPTWPYCVFGVITSNPKDTFTDHLEATIVQFSIRSITSSLTEADDILVKLRALYDNCTLTISGQELLVMRWDVTTFSEIPMVTQYGTDAYSQFDVDYEIVTVVG